jgi:hypothetical protein
MKTLGNLQETVMIFQRTFTIRQMVQIGFSVPSKLRNKMLKNCGVQCPESRPEQIYRSDIHSDTESRINSQDFQFWESLLDFW